MSVSSKDNNGKMSVQLQIDRKEKRLLSESSKDLRNRLMEGIGGVRRELT